LGLSERMGNKDPAPKLYSSSATLGHSKIVKKVSTREADIRALKQEAIARLTAQDGGVLSGSNQSSTVLEERVIDAVAWVIDNSTRPLPKIDRGDLVQSLVDELIGTGPIEPFLRDPSVTEIMVNGFDQVFIERDGKITKSAIEFENEDHLRSTIERIVSRVGRRIDESSPLVDARLPDGSRVNAVIPPIALGGSNITIRKFAAEALTIDNLLANGTLTEECAEYLRACVHGKLNIIISGGTGSGKTTTLNVVSAFIPEAERIITIEDSAELQLNKPHVVRLESRPVNVEGKGTVSIRDLVKNSLRMRPDRIIVGEVRDGTAFDMLQAMNTGHEGSLTTVHANSPLDALTRVESMSLMAGMEIPLTILREQISQSIHVILQQSRLVDGSRRVTSIIEISGFENNRVQFQEIFRYNYFATGDDHKGGGLVRVPEVTSIFGERIRSRGVSAVASIFG